MCLKNVENGHMMVVNVVQYHMCSVPYDWGDKNLYYKIYRIGMQFNSGLKRDDKLPCYGNKSDNHMLKRSTQSRMWLSKVIEDSIQTGTIAANEVDAVYV